MLQPLPRPPARHTQRTMPGPNALPARLLLLHVAGTQGPPLRPADIGRREVLCQLSAFGEHPRYKRPADVGVGMTRQCLMRACGLMLHLLPVQTAAQTALTQLSRCTGPFNTSSCHCYGVLMCLCMLQSSRPARVQSSCTTGMPSGRRAWSSPSLQTQVLVYPSMRLQPSLQRGTGHRTLLGQQQMKQHCPAAMLQQSAHANMQCPGPWSC